MMAFSPSSASGARISKILAIFLFVGVFFALSSSLTANAQEEEDWQPVVTKMEEYLEGIPAEYASGDSKAVNTPSEKLTMIFTRFPALKIKFATVSGGIGKKTLLQFC